MIQSSSYSEYFLSCIDSPFISDKCKAATEFLPLYSKLFDTNHFSLTDYIKNKFALNKYFDLKNGLPVREESYYEFQIHNSFVLPMLYYVLLAIITEHYHTNFTEVIQNELHKYICEYMDTYYSYRNRFLNIFNKVSKLEKSLNISDNKVNKFKKSLIFASTEKDKIPYKINESIYASFFLTDLGQQPFPGQYLKRGSITPYDIAEENSCFYNINEPSLNFNSNIGPMIR